MILVITVTTKLDLRKVCLNSVFLSTNYVVMEKLLCALIVNGSKPKTGL